MIYTLESKWFHRNRPQEFLDRVDVDLINRSTPYTCYRYCGNDHAVNFGVVINVKSLILNPTWPRVTQGDRWTRIDLDKQV